MTRTSSLGARPPRVGTGGAASRSCGLPRERTGGSGSCFRAMSGRPCLRRSHARYGRVARARVRRRPAAASAASGSVAPPVPASLGFRIGTPGVTPTDAATATRLPRRCSTLAPPTGRSAPPLARFTPAASTRAAVSTPSTRLPVLVRFSSAEGDCEDSRIGLSGSPVRIGCCSRSPIRLLASTELQAPSVSSGRERDVSTAAGSPRSSRRSRSMAGRARHPRVASSVVACSTVSCSCTPYAIAARWFVESEPGPGGVSSLRLVCGL